MDPLDIALIVSDDKAVVDAIQHETNNFDSSFNFDLEAMIKLKKLWAFRKQAAPDPSSQSAPSSAAKDDEENLLEGAPEAIEQAWIEKQGFYFNGSRLLIGADYNRV